MNMKCTLSYILLINFYCGICGNNDHNETLQTRGVIENTINSTLDKIKENLPDPIAIASMPFDFGHGKTISGGFNVTKLIINGVKDFVADEIKVQVFQQTLDMKVTVPEVSAQFKYWTDMVLADLVPFYGEGRMSITFDEIEIGVNAGATWTGGPKIKDIWLSVTLNEAVFHLDGMLNNPEYSAIVSSILNDNFADFINENSELVSSVISPIAQAIVDHYIGKNEEPTTIRGVKVFVRQ